MKISIENSPGLIASVVISPKHYKLYSIQILYIFFQKYKINITFSTNFIGYMVTRIWCYPDIKIRQCIKWKGNYRTMSCKNIDGNVRQKMLATKSSTYPKHHITWPNGTNYKNKRSIYPKVKIYYGIRTKFMLIHRDAKKKKTLIKCTFYCQIFKNLGMKQTSFT